MSPRHLRTLWLVGFTCAVVGLSCQTETGGRRCVDDPTSRYFNVHWSIDNGTVSQPLPHLLCSQAPQAHVVLTTTANQTLQVGVSCDDAHPYIADGFVYNFLGSTVDGLPVGTEAAVATLVSDLDSTNFLATANVPRGYTIGGCSGVDLVFQFPLTPEP